MDDEQQLPPLESSDEDEELKQAPKPPVAGASSTPSNTPVVSFFAKDPSAGSAAGQKRGFEGADNTDLVNKMLGALNVGNTSQNDDDDDEDEEDDEDDEDEEDDEDDDYIAQKEEVEAALPALQANQKDLDKLHDEYTKARRDLEVKFDALRAPLYAARAELVRGEVLPGFWLDAMRGSRLLSQFVEEWDEPCLMFLDNITCTEINDKDNLTFGFELEFFFAKENPFFTNHTLKKRAVITNHYPMDGSVYPDVVALEGTKIDWKPNQNLTVRIEVKKEIKRAGKGGKKGPAKEVRQEVPQESFFTFFDTPEDLTEEQMEELGDEEQEAVQSKWEQDFAIASTFRAKLIPNAVNWYTGDASDSEYDDDEEEDDEDYDDYDDDEGDFEELDSEEDSEDDDEAPKPGKKKAGGARAAAAAKKNAAAGDEEKKPECNQQ